MKTCNHCGHENPEEAARCLECGRELAVASAEPQASQRWAGQPWKRITVLGGEVEAERLDVELTRLQIPHVMVTYSDSAMDGLYQTSKGWGHIEAPEQEREAILTCLQDLREIAAPEAQDEEPRLDGPPA